jgi:hypothetical protein
MESEQKVSIWATFRDKSGPPTSPKERAGRNEVKSEGDQQRGGALRWPESELTTLSPVTESAKALAKREETSPAVSTVALQAELPGP